MNDIKNAILNLRKSGAVIVGATYTDANGVRSERDLQIGVNLGHTHPPFGRWLDDKKTIIEHNGKLLLQAVDRNKARKIRLFNPAITTTEAARNSVRTFRLDRIDSLRYCKVEVATS